MTTPRAFGSHSSQDRAFVERFAADLRAKGIDAWYSGWEIKPGDSIRGKIEEGLGECDYFIIVLSKISIERPWVLSELDTATVRKINGKVKKIIPIKIDECADVPAILGSLCWEDFSDQSYDTALERIIDSIFERDVRPPLGARNVIGIPLARNVPKPPQNEQTKDTLPVCDWVYFATPSQEDWSTTSKAVEEFRMIFRTVYNAVGIPIANVRQLRQGDTILLVYGGGRSNQPYRPIFCCTVVPPPRPIPSFEALSYADASQHERLKNLGFTPDPHFREYTGISVEISQDLRRLAGSIRRPGGNNAIRRWSEVFGVRSSTLGGSI